MSLLLPLSCQKVEARSAAWARSVQQTRRRTPGATWACAHQAHAQAELEHRYRRRGTHGLSRNFLQPLHKFYRFFMTLLPGCSILYDMQKDTTDATLEQALYREAVDVE